MTIRNRDEASYGSLLTPDSPMLTPTSLNTDKVVEEEVELNEVYERIGVGPGQYWAWAAVGLMGYSDYAELTLISIIMPSLRCQWDLSSGFEAAIAVCMYSAYAVMSMVMGRVADVYGRKRVVAASLIILILGVVVSVASPNRIVFLCGRIVVGACAGVNWTTNMCYATEFVESGRRTVGVAIGNLASLCAMFIVGAVALALLNTVGWRWFEVIVSLPLIPTLAIVLWLPDSPRYLCVSGQREAAARAVRFLARLNKVTLPHNLNIKCYQDTQLGVCWKILSKEYLRPTLTLSLMFCCCVFVGFGLIAYIPLMFKTDYCGLSKSTPVHETCALLSQSDLIHVTAGTFLLLIGVVGATFAANSLGRLKPLRIVSGLQVIGVGCIFVCMDSISKTVVSSLCATVNVIISYILWIIIPESYPTNFRSTAVGFINGWARIGGVLGSGTVYFWLYTEPTVILGLFVGCSIVGFIATLCFNQETRDVSIRDT